MANAIDKDLLQQYLDVLGVDGLAASLAAFSDLMPVYLSELDDMVAAEDETAVRKQAHKIKGGCSSLGFVRLGLVMKQIERDSWLWQELPQQLTEWRTWLAEDDKLAQQWLNEKRLEKSKA